MQNTKGLSEIVATLIIILLTLVAVGIIWVVIRGVVTNGAGQISVSAECTAINLNAVSVQETPAGSGIYSVILHRAAGGGNLSGIKVSVLNANGSSSGPMDFGSLPELGQNTMSLNTASLGSNVTHGNSIEFTPFFTDPSGNQQLCSQTQTFQF
ncbi:MAG: archaellin/type IV pilin N-terminal domain-containing protein [Candidatus Pacearchaeota archaeon]|jgi:flagellin-like protein